MISSAATKKHLIEIAWTASTSWILRNRRRRWLVFATADGLLVVIAGVLAFLLEQPDSGGSIIAISIGLSLLVKSAMFHLFGLYGVSWNYISVRELLRISMAVTVGSGILMLAAFVPALLTGSLAVHPKVMLLDFLISLVLLGAFRSSRRVARELSRKQVKGYQARRVLIAGAGSSGEQIVRRLHEAVHVEFIAVGFVDDDVRKHGMAIHGVPVLGSRSDIPSLLMNVEPDEVWIAMPSASRSVVRETVDLCKNAGVGRIKILPGTDVLLSGQVRLSDIREVRPEDLLGRDVVDIDSAQVSRYLTGKRVLVTGAAGSIGSELCRQIAAFGPAELVLIDQDETGIFNLQNDLTLRIPSLETFPIVASVCDQPRISRIFAEVRPQVVFHAAAYKHVPLMEQHPQEAVHTNVLGTWIVGRAAKHSNAESFVLISTDKAVNPTSVMGATKRAAEVVVQDLGSDGDTKFVSVRFGNVLGSRGSVVPTFKEQILRGGPVTVTHPDMKRYFMTIPEAVLLVLQAGAVGRSGQVLVLDMGEPVRILDLARQMIRLSGFEPDRDIPIVFTGLRPGEKLFEDILSAEEGTQATLHDRIFVARVSGGLAGECLYSRLLELRSALECGNRQDLLTGLRHIVPTYRPYEPPIVGNRVPLAANTEALH